MTVEKLIENETFSHLYKGKETEAAARLLRMETALCEAVGTGETAFFSVPGRTEVMGNHTDHNHGRVLAASVDLDVVAAARPRGDGIVRIKSEGFPEDVVDLSDLSVHEDEKFTSAAIIRGVAAAFAERGRKIGGFTAFTTSDVPGGSGLSSSAAFENMVGTIFNHFYNDGEIGYVELAQISQRAENRHFGKPCGLMDQIACAAGGFVTIDFADPEKPVAKKIAFDVESAGYRLCIVKTGGSHADLNDDYASIPAEMKAVAGYFGKPVLCGVTKEEILENANALRPAVGDRAILRALHFISENERVSRAIPALEAGDIDAFLRLVNESGESSAILLQNYFTVKAPAEQGITLAVAIAKTAMGEKGAARVHGGGFAGTAQAFVPAEKWQSFLAAAEAAFGKGTVTPLTIRAEGAVRIL